MSEFREERGQIKGHLGLRLSYRTWIPSEPKGSMVLVHGTNEHTGRYRHVGEYFAREGLAVYALDQRGHGESQGTRCHVDHFDDYLHDLRHFTAMAQMYGRPIMVGHSLGGLIAYRYALAYPATIAALVLSSPMFQIKVQPSRLEKALAPLMSRVLPRFGMPAKIPPEHVSRSKAVAEAYAKDPLVGRTVTPRWFTECGAAGREALLASDDGPAVPVLFLQAGDDLLVDPEATRQVYDRVKHPQKRFRLYPDKYHEIFNDPGYEKVLAEVNDWLKEQLADRAHR